MSALTPGVRLGPYEIVGAIGAGGMGEVYKATDTRLARPVAIKVLPAHWSDDAGMKERFEREAQTIASLNHPNICALHDVGSAPAHEIGLTPEAAGGASITFLVMEYLEGETLASRLEQGALGLNDALDIAIPIADALDQAHRRGVVHRDLKPANVMLTPTGPKLLDFGIAKAVAHASGAEGLTARALTTPLTMQGMVLGTLQYMAPEQIDGLEADARTDIFAFGTLLHEMVTGKRAFEGKSQALLISSIATSEPPPLSSVQPATPPALDQVVKGCLAKDPDDRWQTARDLVAELRWIAEGGAASAPVALIPAGPTGRSSWIRVSIVVAGVLAAVLAVPASLYTFGGTGEAAAETRYRLYSPAPTYQFDPVFEENGSFALSPDGRRVAFVGQSREPTALFVGQVGSVSYMRLPGTDGASQPFWSADGRAVGFVANGVLKRVDASGGPPETICSAPSFFGGTWNGHGSILFGSATGIQRVSAEGGTPEPVTSLVDDESGHFWPSFLPDGDRFLYLSWSAAAGGRALYVTRLGEAGRSRIMAAESNAGYTTAGNLVFHREGTVYAQSVDPSTLAPVGQPQRVADGLTFSKTTGRGLFEVARDGTLAYQDTAVAGGATRNRPETLDLQPTWVDLAGTRPETVGRAGVYRGAEVSPDGTRIALHQHDGTGGDVWVIEPGGSRRRMTFDPTQDNSSPIWSPDGTTLVFSSRRDGKWGLYKVPSNAAGSPELLHEDEVPIVATSWAPDGSRLVFWKQSADTRGDLFVLPLDGEPKPEPVAASPADETHGQVSPDGKWLAFASNETRADQYEVYVQPFPSGAGRYQLSTAGGDWPRWSADGRRLFFLPPIPALETFRHDVFPMSAVDVGASGTALDYGQPEPVIRFYAFDFPHEGGDYPTYAVAPDGQRLLVFQRVEPQDFGAGGNYGADTLFPPYGLTIARHWEATLGSGRR